MPARHCVAGPAQVARQVLSICAAASLDIGFRCSDRHLACQREHFKPPLQKKPRDALLSAPEFEDFLLAILPEQGGGLAGRVARFDAICVCDMNVVCQCACCAS